jgi:hypothetical protein
MKRNTFCVILSVVSFFLAGCGGGGGDGSVSSPGSQPQGPATYLLFSGGSIGAVDPLNPSSPVTVELAETEGEAGVLHATWDGLTGDLTGAHLRTIVYASNGKLFKVNALKSGSLTPSQVSNETAATGICDAFAELDFSNHNNAVYIYELPGPDTDCIGDTDNIWKMVRVGMSSSNNPITIKKMVETLYNEFNLSIIGFLAIDGNTLVRCDQNFQGCSQVSPFTISVESLRYNPFVGVAVLQIDGKLYTYDVSQGVLSSSSLHTLSGGTSASVPSEMDATHFYFADGPKLLRLPLTGISQASLLVQESSGEIVELEQTRNRVAYIVLNNFSTPQTQSLKTISKSGGISTIVAQPTADFISMMIATRDFVYYQQELTSVAVREDGLKREVAGAVWVGFTYNSSLFVAKVIRVDGCTPSSCAGGVLKSADADTNSSEIVLGNLPSDFANPPFFFGIGSDSLGAAFDAQGNLDVFYVKPGQANSLIRVTQTQDISELPIF